MIFQYSSFRKTYFSKAPNSICMYVLEQLVYRFPHRHLTIFHTRIYKVIHLRADWYTRTQSHYQKTNNNTLRLTCLHTGSNRVTTFGISDPVQYQKYFCKKQNKNKTKQKQNQGLVPDLVIYPFSPFGKNRFSELVAAALHYVLYFITLKHWKVIAAWGVTT